MTEVFAFSAATASTMGHRCRVVFASIAERRNAESTSVNTGWVGHRVRHGRLYGDVYGIRHVFVDEHRVRVGNGYGSVDGVRVRHVNRSGFVQQQFARVQSEVVASVQTMSVEVEPGVESQQRNVPFLRRLLLAVLNRQHHLKQQQQQQQQRPQTFLHRKLHESLTDWLRVPWIHHYLYPSGVT